MAGSSKLAENRRGWPVDVFISHAQADEELRGELETHLAGLGCGRRASTREPGAHRGRGRLEGGRRSACFARVADIGAGPSCW